MAAFMQRLFNIEAFLASTCYILVALAIILDIAAREFFQFSIFGIQRIAVFLVIAVAYIGMALAAGQNKHLRPRFADNWAPASWRLFIERFGDLLAAVLFTLMGVIAAQMVMTTYEYGWDATVIRFPLWMVQWVMPYGFFSTAFRYAIFFIRPDLKPTEIGG
jgi:TRAP-type C4-dicarboxylate transport system permease small subunit